MARLLLRRARPLFHTAGRDRECAQPSGQEVRPQDQEDHGPENRGCRSNECESDAIGPRQDGKPMAYATHSRSR